MGIFRRGTKDTSADNPDSKTCKDWRARVGPINHDISANEMMWEFFRKHPEAICLGKKLGKEV